MPITCSRYNLQKPFVSIRRTRASLKKYFGECVCMVPIYYLHHLFYHWQWLWRFRACYSISLVSLASKQWTYLSQNILLCGYVSNTHLCLSSTRSRSILRFGFVAYKNTIETIAIIQRFRCTLKRVLSLGTNPHSSANRFKSDVATAISRKINWFYGQSTWT